MNALSSIFFLYLPITLVGVLLASGRSGALRLRLLAIVGSAWIILGTLVAVMHARMPYAMGGDDEDYFLLALIPVGGFGDFFDFSRFIGLADQPGYPWFLSAFQTFAGRDLLAYKMSNLCLLILTSLIWGRIAARIESSAFGLVVGVALLFLTPLWYYAFFLFKDMTIVFLQSLFVMGLVRYWGGASGSALLLMIFASFATILFRAPLVAQQASVMASAVLLKFFTGSGEERATRRIFPVLLAGAVAFGILAAAANPDLMLLMGVSQEGRVLEAGATLEMAQGLNIESRGPVAFAVIYLLSEISGFSPQAWETMDAAWLRGALAIPWVLFVLPFLAFGIVGIMRPASPNSEVGQPRMMKSRMFASSWSVIVLFVASSAFAAWIVGDTTRWRLSDMPPLLMIALAGWKWTGRRLRSLVLLAWLVGWGFAWSSYYLFKAL